MSLLCPGAHTGPGQRRRKEYLSASECPGLPSCLRGTSDGCFRPSPAGGVTPNVRGDGRRLQTLESASPHPPAWAGGPDGAGGSWVTLRKLPVLSEPQLCHQGNVQGRRCWSPQAVGRVWERLRGEPWVPCLAHRRLSRRSVIWSVRFPSALSPPLPRWLQASYSFCSTSASCASSSPVLPSSGSQPPSPSQPAQLTFLRPPGTEPAPTQHACDFCSKPRVSRLLEGRKYLY